MEDKNNVTENVDFTSDILLHIRLWDIKAVSLNLFFSTTPAVETIIWQVYDCSFLDGMSAILNAKVYTERRGGNR